MKVVVLLNAGSGSVGVANAEERAVQVREAFAAAAIEADVQLCEPARLTESARRAATSGIDAVVAGGGDGTVSSIVNGLVESDVPLAVLPLGTLNHFARDIGMPKDLEDAARAIAARRTARIDVAEVNGRCFVNNSSIGLYPEMVIVREVEQRRAKRSKWTAMAIAAARVFRRFPLLHVRVITPEHAMRMNTPFVFVGNNPYTIDVFSLGTRPRLDTGRLGLYMVRSTGRFHMFWLMVRALVQRLDAVRDFEAVTVTEAWIDVPRRALPVALDGEVVGMRSPLHYRIRPAALTVLLGPAAERAGAVSEPAIGAADKAS